MGGASRLLLVKDIIVPMVSLLLGYGCPIQIPIAGLRCSIERSYYILATPVIIPRASQRP